MIVQIIRKASATTLQGCLTEQWTPTLADGLTDCINKRRARVGRGLI